MVDFPIPATVGETVLIVDATDKQRAVSVVDMGNGTNGLVVSGSGGGGGGGGTGTNGQTAPTTSVSNGYTNTAGKQTAVSPTTPLPDQPYAVANSVAPSYTANSLNPLLTDLAGNLKVNVVTGGGANNSVSGTGATAPAYATEMGGVYNTTPPTLTSGQLNPVALDVNGNQQVRVVAGEIEDTLWTDDNGFFFVWRDIGTPSAPNFVAINPASNLVYIPGNNPRPAEHNDNIKGNGSASSSSNLSVQSVVIAGAGSGYKVGDIILLAGGTYITQASLAVTQVTSAGGIVTVSPSKWGSSIGQYSVFPTSPVSQSAAPASGGTGATFTLTSASNVVYMLETTGYSVLLSVLGSNSASSQLIMQGSIDGVTWFACAWGYGAAESYTTGYTGSWSAGTSATVRTVYPYMRLMAQSATNAAATWSLKSLPVDQQAVITQQGPNQGTNNYWYSNTIAGSGGGPGNRATVVSAATTNATLLSSISYTTPRIYNLAFGNSGTAAAYLKLYAKYSAAPVPGTDTPFAVYPILPGQMLHIDAGSMGIQSSSNGLGLAITANPALNDSTALASAGTISGTINWQ